MRPVERLRRPGRPASRPGTRDALLRRGLDRACCRGAGRSRRRDALLRLGRGIGTASRRAGPYTVGVLLLVNFGDAEDLRIDGDAVGARVGAPPTRGGEGSCACVLATDAPLLPQQLERVARRIFLGLARTGSYGANGSGEVAVAFSTANRAALRRDQPGSAASIEMLRNGALNELFAATVEASEEAVLNALFGARTVNGPIGTTHAFDVERWRATAR